MKTANNELSRTQSEGSLVLVPITRVIGGNHHTAEMAALVLKADLDGGAGTAAI
jgi:hypothetical protein